MIIDGKKVASETKEELKKAIVNERLNLTLAVIQVGNNEASNIYIRQKEKVAAEIGINFLHIKFNENEKEEIIIDEIKKLNDDDNISGIIIQLPVPKHLNEKKLLNFIIPNKDVDGLTNINRIKLLNKENGIVPCTPLGIIKLLKYYNIDVSGKHVVIIGRSDLVSKPLFNLLLNMDATVTICHTKTRNLGEITSTADILISATGSSKLIKKDMVKSGATIIDVGISKINDVLSGDADFENIKDKVSYITPVPGGVGPMTVIMLMQNVINSK